MREDTAGTPTWLRAGAEVEGRYRMIAPLGRGGVGMVWSAEHLKLQRKVAVKILQADVGESSTARKRFEREAKMLASLSHPNIVTPTDYGIWHGSPYLVMELLQGDALYDLLGPGKTLPWERAVDIVRQLCRALSYAHSQGVIHRDLKPANVFLQALRGEPDQVKLLDFGFAKSLDAPAASNVTATGVIVGTPTYMAPEAATGNPLDTRADVYGLGVLLFEMLTGRRPFEGEPIDVIRTRLKEDAPTMREVRPDLHYPGWLHDAVTKALARKPEDRFQTASELSAALVDPAVPSQPSSSGSLPSDTIMDAPPRPDPPKPPFRAIAALAVLGVLVLSWNAYRTRESMSDAAVPPDAAGDPEPPDAAVAPDAAGDLGPPDAAIAPEPPVPPEPAIEPTPPEPPDTSASAPPAPAHADPWAASPVPPDLAALRALVHAPAPPSRADIRSLRAYAQAHRDDPRPVLLLAQAFARMHWMDESLETYVRAFTMSDTSAGDPDALSNLVALAAAESTTRGASDLIALRYGREALPVIEATLAAPDLRDPDRERLDALVVRISGASEDPP